VGLPKKYSYQPGSRIPAVQKEASASEWELRGRKINGIDKYNHDFGIKYENGDEIKHRN
jgi:hypothetical protein